MVYKYSLINFGNPPHITLTFLKKICTATLTCCSAFQIAERHDTILTLKNEAKELEEKHRDALATVNHRGEVIKTLRDDLKQANIRVRRTQSDYFKVILS